MYVKPLDQLLPRHQKVGVFPCVVIHHGKEIKCSACGEKGHGVADRNCKAKPKKNILAFKSYEHPLGNHFPCELEVFDNKFKSVEEACFWRMSLEIWENLIWQRKSMRAVMQEKQKRSVRI